MEKIKDREELVKKVIEKLKDDYIDCTKNNYVNKAISEVSFENPNEDTESNIIFATLLLWVKQNLIDIDINKSIFTYYWKRVGEEDAIFTIQTSDLNAILHYNNFIWNMYFRLMEEYPKYGINTIFILESIEPTNFAYTFIGILDKLLAEKGQTI